MFISNLRPDCRQEYLIGMGESAKHEYLCQFEHDCIHYREKIERGEISQERAEQAVMRKLEKYIQRTTGILDFMKACDWLNTADYNGNIFDIEEEFNETFRENFLKPEKE